MKPTDYITDDFRDFPVSEWGIKQAFALRATYPQMENWQYVQFHRMRKSINRNFADPFDVEPFEDETGVGYVTHMSDHQDVDSLVFELLETFIKHQGFLKLHIESTGIFKVRDECRDSTGGTFTLNHVSKLTYRVKLYTSLK